MIIAVDPGKRTGLASLRLEDAGRPGFFESWELDCWEAVDWIDRRLHKVTELVCEDYIITMQTLKKTRGENWSLESIGALRYLTRRADVPFTLQQPGDAKRFATDTKLDRMGWHRPTAGGHADDAARHLLLYMVRTNRLDVVSLTESEGGPTSS